MPRNRERWSSRWYLQDPRRPKKAGLVSSSSLEPFPPSMTPSRSPPMRLPSKPVTGVNTHTGWFIYEFSLGNLPRQPSCPSSKWTRGSTEVFPELGPRASLLVLINYKIMIIRIMIVKTFCSVDVYEGFRVIHNQPRSFFFGFVVGFVRDRWGP